MPLTGALVPFAPFNIPVEPPAANWDDAPRICIQINETWATYLMGAAQALAAQATWNSDDENVVAACVQNAVQMIGAIASLEACPMVQFRVNPDNPYYWDYSNDAGATWTRQPDTVQYWQANWETDPMSPSGLAVTINSGLSRTVLPKPIGTDPDAVVTDPLTALVNTIAPIAGVPGMLVKALNDFAVYLESNNISLHLAKGSDRGTPDAAPVFEIDAPDSYDFPLLVTNT